MTLQLPEKPQTIPKSKRPFLSINKLLFIQMIKQLIFSVAFILAVSFSLHSQTLLTVDGEDISLDEFLAIYNKNNASAQAIDPKTKEEYLELFINFKLKVREAREMGMDTIGSFQKELAGYRRQLAAPYMTDQKVTDELIQEAYDRKKQDVKVSHILVRLLTFPKPADTLKAWSKINALHNKIKDPTADFERVAKQSSEDPSAKDNGGNLGYFSAFQMVYPFESAAYNTDVGKVSNVVRTKFGYHLLWVVDKRAARGEIKTSHIMIQFAEEDSEEVLADKEKKANEIYEKLKAGADFSEMAKQYSDDKGSSKDGGALPWFGTGRMVENFENAAFALENNGDFSQPIKTRFGWHIIQRNDLKGIPTFEEIEEDLERQVARDSRSRMSQDAFYSRVKSEYGYKLNTRNLSALKKTIDSSYFEGKWKAKEKAAGMNKVIFSLDGSKYKGVKKDYTQADMALYLEKNKRFQRKPETDVEVIVNSVYNDFVNESLSDYENELLENKYPEFKALMQEYHDGILLFDLMDKKVWSKAVKDTVGLKSFYESHKQDYIWPERLEAFIFTCENEEVAKRTRKYVKKKAKSGELEKEDILNSINLESQLSLTVDNGKYAKGDNEMLDKIEWIKGFTENSSSEGKIKFVYVEDVLPSQAKELKEARGLIISAYQDQLEKEWIESLRSKYPVVINSEVLK